MDPYDERRLRDEVIYLHSLWHHGPPRSTSTNSSNHPLHQLYNRTQFKREGAKPRAQRVNGRSRNGTNRNREEESLTEPIQASGKEWPCNPTFNNVASTSVWPTVTAQSNSQALWPSAESGKELPCNPSSDTPAPTSGWPTVTVQRNSQPIFPSPDEQARFAANQAQFKAVKATIQFFRTNNSDGDDEIVDDDDDELEEDNEVDDDEHHDDLIEEEYGDKNFRFFVKVFEEDSNLKAYYEKNYQNGDFSCFVCCGAGIKKARKRFKDCVALIQHSVSIARTKKRRAHRAYGKVICKVLGWDIDKLPTIVSALTENLGLSVNNSCASKGEAPTSACPTVAATSQTFSPSAETGKEWPCNPSSDTPAPSYGWLTVTAQYNSQPILPSPEEQARMAANQAQFKAVKATIEFFRSNDSDDDDNDELGEDNEGDEYEHHDDLVEEEYGGEENSFFVKVFEEGSDLREYYEKNYQSGGFHCLVCCGAGIKKARRFKDCVALIQHSVSIARTKKRSAHRAYGKAVCKVLGWDIDNIPTIVSALTENLGVSLSNSGASEGEALGYVGDKTKDNLNVLDNPVEAVDTDNSSELQEKESTSYGTLPSNDETIVSEHFLAAADTFKGDKDPKLTAPKIVEDKELGQPSDMEIPKEVTVVLDEGKGTVPDDLVKIDNAS